MNTDLAQRIYRELQRLARTRGIATDLLLNRYAVERFLYRLSQTPLRDRYILKGASLFTIWARQPYRATRDVDFAGFGPGDLAAVTADFRAIVRVPVPDDGLVFAADGAFAEVIRHDTSYGGVTVRIPAQLHTARPSFQIDIGFGDAITPAALETPYPGLLPDDFGIATPVVRAYPRETVVAEKWQAMVALGLANSRMKDFFDLFVLSRAFPFNGQSLTNAIAATFARRGTALPPAPPIALTPAFSGDTAKRQQWQAFIRRGGISGGTPPLDQITAALASFLMPPTQGLVAGTPFTLSWPPGGPWQ